LQPSIKTKQSKKIDLTTVSIWASFMLIGLAFTVYGPTITYLVADYQISLGQAGLFISFMAMGRMLSVIISGVLTDVFGRKPLLIMGTFFLTLGLAGIGSLSWFTGGLIFAGLAGIGHAMVDTSASAAITELNPENVSKYMNISHMFFGIGCLIGPLIAGTLLTFNINWRIIYILKAIIGLSITLLLAFQQFPQIEKSNNSPFNFKGMLSFSVLLLAGVIFLYSGVGHSLNTWIHRYIEEISGLAVFFAASSLAFYNFGLTSGRFVCSFFTEKLGYKKTILILSCLSFCAILLALLSRTDFLVVLGFGLTGFFFGGLFPTTIAIACNLFPEQRGTITGVLITLAALGSMTIPVSIGYLAEFYTLLFSFRILIIYVAALIVISLLLYRQEQ